MKFKRTICVLISLLTILSLFAAIPVSGASKYSMLKKNQDYHYGIDVSKWNGDLNWENLKNEGIEFAYIRVGLYDKEGGHLDDAFKRNVKACVENGIEFGVYVYTKIFRYNENVACAKWVDKQLKSMGNYCKDKDTIQVAYDIEDYRYIKALNKKVINKSYLHNSMLKFTNTIKKLGYVPVVYSSLSFFNDYLNLSGLQKNGCRIWYARWPKVSTLDFSEPIKLPNGTNPEVWQYASYYHIDNKLLDTNICYDDFYDYGKENSTLTVKDLKDTYSYSSNGVEPEIKVYDKNKLLQKDTDYQIKYFCNKTSGTARMKIIRYKNGEYLETKTVKYIIKPAIKNLKATYYTNNVQLSWNKYFNKGYFKVYKYNDETDSYDLIKKTTSSSFNDNGLSSGNTYTYKITPVQMINGKYYSGKSVVITDTTKLKKVTISPIEYKKGNDLLLEWNTTDKEITGYEVQYSIDDEFKTYKGITCKEQETIIKSSSLKKDKEYNIRVRAYKENNNIKSYSDFSIIHVVET